MANDILVNITALERKKILKWIAEAHIRQKNTY